LPSARQVKRRKVGRARTLPAIHELRLIEVAAAGFFDPPAAAVILFEFFGPS